MRVLIVDDEGRSLPLVLRGMEFAEITVVEGVEEASRLCAAGAADACLLLMRDFRPDEPLPLADGAAAPGRDSGIPSLLLAEVVTPYVSRLARRSGYVRAIAMTTSAQLLYRTISAALQHARRRPTFRGRPVMSDSCHGRPNRRPAMALLPRNVTLH
jgi:hypothetical protein